LLFLQVAAEGLEALLEQPLGRRMASDDAGVNFHTFPGVSREKPETQRFGTAS